MTLNASDKGSGEGDSLLLPAAIAVTGATIQERAITYTYAPLQRLTAAYSTGETYAYDAVGNRTVMTGATPLSGIIVTTYTYDWSAGGQLLTEWTQGCPVREFTYNAAGRMIRAANLAPSLHLHFGYAQCKHRRGPGGAASRERGRHSGVRIAYPQRVLFAKL